VAAGAAQTFATRLALANTGKLTLTPAAGQAALRWSGGNGSLDVSGADVVVEALGGKWLLLGAAGAVVAPKTDNALALGWTDHRWTTVYAVAGTINTSSLKDKDPAGDLDPEAALGAVLRTPARRFRYKGTERLQSGYYLEEADPLFTIGPDEASPSNDAGVLLAALQALCARLGITA